MLSDLTRDDWLNVLGLGANEAHARGLARLREYMASHPDDPWLVEESMTLCVGRKPV